MNNSIRLIISFTLFCAVNSFAHADKLILSIHVIRHGDRTPIIELPAAPLTWREGLGQLTAKGMQQEFQLGRQWRQYYIDKEHLLPAVYDHRTLLVNSTNYDRTLMSAQALLMGLYPPGTGPRIRNHQAALPYALQPIPIHTQPLEQENLLLPEEPRKKFPQLVQQHVFSRRDWQQKTTALQPQFARWGQLTGLQISDLLQLSTLSDTLYIRQLYHLPLPPGLTAAEAKTIIQAGKWATATIYTTKEIAAIGRPLLIAIIHYLQAAAEQSSPLKFILFSAHDSTILSLMSAMNAPLEMPPRYASDVNISLYQHTQNNYQVTVSFNGKAVAIPACQHQNCSLAEFIAIIKNDASITNE